MSANPPTENEDQALPGSLEELQLEAKRIDASPDGPTPDPSVLEPEPVKPTNAQVIGFFITTFRELACVMLDAKSPRETLNDAKIDEAAKAIGPVADKYGIDLNAWVGDYMPELNAAIVAGPILLVAWKGLESELSERRKAKAAEAAAKKGPVPTDPPPPAMDASELVD